MSFFSPPDEMVSVMNEMEKTWSRLDSELSAAMPKEMAAAVNLLSHPAAGFAAASAIGLGLASQVAGIWMGSVAGAFDAAQRMASLAVDAVPEPKASKAAARAKAAADTLMADAKSLAREVADISGQPVAAPAAKPAKSVAKRKPRADTAPQRAAREAPAVDIRIVKPAAMEKPAAPDDLKAISGIGPKLEQVLNGLGIWTYAQIAAWTSAEVGWVDDQLGFSGRIWRDDWIGQAKQLAGEKRDG
jgi:NADH-quinone oxidoreductase subunit E